MTFVVCVCVCVCVSAVAILAQGKREELGWSGSLDQLGALAGALRRAAGATGPGRRPRVPSPGRSAPARGDPRRSRTALSRPLVVHNGMVVWYFILVGLLLGQVEGPQPFPFTPSLRPGL